MYALCVAASLFIITLLALVIGRTDFPPIHSEHEDSGDRGHFSELFRCPHLWLAVAAQVTRY